ncbi:MAG TPA: C4-type zinc ribbon domain-containing protein [Ktedonobacterales bacterium]|nr:C4-type zinc ribbon domain-containing protein [Ktedonobacterales bacterium]
MTRTTKAASLYQVQQLDGEVDRIAAEAQAINAALQDDSAVRQVQQAVTAASTALQQRQQALRAAEQELADLAARIKSHNDRLYSGNVSNPRELGSLQQEVGHLRELHNTQEERVLEAMAAAEEAQTLMESEKTRQEALEKTRQQEQAMLVDRQRQVEARLADARQRRQSQAESCEAPLLQRYEQIRRIRGKAVALAEGGTCQGCRVSLTASDMQRVRTSADITTCSNCGRILYLP